MTGSKLNLKSVTVPNATNATNATNANTLGGNPATAFQSSAKVLFASVSTSAAGATLDRGQGAVSAVRFIPGVYFVSFNRNILGCTWLGTYGVTNTGASLGDFVTVEGRGTTTPNDIEVRERDLTNTPVDGQGFHLLVLCP